MPTLDGEEVLVGESYLVRGRRGCWRNATVLDKRRGDDGCIELYIHFDGDDRRLDHWLNSRRFKFRDQINKRIIPPCEMREKRVRKTKENSPVTASVDYAEVLEEEHKEVTKVKYIEVVRYGEFEMDTWYFSPYPEEYGKERYLFICDKCLLYMRQERAFKMHLCLCLFAKLFMDHKTIYFDVTGFLFYVVCQPDDTGVARSVGYFSKERTSPDGHNLSCICVFPAFQRQGFGSFLIQLSYELSRREGIQGSPEKPLSDLGLASFRHYWSYLIVNYISGFMDTSWISVSNLAKALASVFEGMHVEDVIGTLHWLQICDPTTISEAAPDLELWVHVHIKHLDSLRKLAARPPRLMLNSRLLHWRPNV
ncbi:unnamed protein product [Nippostrongylus brasiliensis]|uniref:histone acetyltransferase n=1 Tax=Nippostrongylus brasiliensis TaxID=27835 RepID=A0A0N4XWK7_NIPBR|nr:unnamed protein product [Nippostrongylus brasiliensis]